MSERKDAEEELENELNRGALWAVTYGDVMSYLMIFFLLQFVFTYSKGMPSQFSASAIENQFGKSGTAVQEIFSQKGIQQIARMDVSEDRIRLSFLAPVLFDVGSADLKESSLPHLKALADALKEIPNPVQIEGHTDNQPLGPHMPFKSNWELSSSRAFSVLRYFIGTGIPPARLSALGYGEFQPMDTNSTPEGRAKNRRIEINIMKKKVS